MQVCTWVWVLLMSLYFSTIEGSPSLSSQGNSQFEWGLADSFEGNPGTWTTLPTRPTPSFISTTSKQGADMSPCRASHWRGWPWKIPAWACILLVSEDTHTQSQDLALPLDTVVSASKTKSPWRLITRYMITKLYCITNTHRHILHFGYTRCKGRLRGRTGSLV